MTPTMVLACHECGHRPDLDSVVEAQLLHFQVEHDTDDVVLDLIAVCTCGAGMDFVRTATIGGTNLIADYYRCTCGISGHITRRSKR